MKFFSRDQPGFFYLVEWSKGYIQVWHDWSQLVNPKRYSWINFSILNFNVEWENQLGDGLTIEMGVMGFNLRLKHQFKESALMKNLNKDVLKIETTQKAHAREIKELEDKIEDLKTKKKTSRTTTNTYEAAYYLVKGAALESVKERQVPQNKRDKKGYRKEWSITLNRVPVEEVENWTLGQANCKVRELESRRKYIKNKAKKALTPKW